MLVPTNILGNVSYHRAMLML